ncbi:MAG: FtsW/RodA/SpoVE family cell cycle protein [Clostridia bacterium]|nr:FtsW/RodA/SpoVE family cell cycle protein [Clostridia bacterium]
MSKKKASLKAGKRLCGTVRLFFFLAFLLLFCRDNIGKGWSFAEWNWNGLILAGAVPVMITLGVSLLPRLFPADRLLLSLTNFLCALSVLILYDTKPVYARHQVIAYGIGLVAMVICIYLIRGIRSWRFPAIALMPLSLLLLALPLLIGEEKNGARNWISFAGASMQPSELVKLSLILSVSWFMSRRKMLPCFLFTAACLGLLMLQKDLGTALLYFGVALLLYWASSGNTAVTLLGAAAGGGAAVLGYRLFAHVRLRVAVWRNPWSDYDNSGYQLVQSLMAIASGGILGVGLGLGSPTTIPVFESDFIFSVICEQFGVIFGLCVLMMYVALIWRGTVIAMAARGSFHALTAMGCTVLIGLQTFVIIGGVIKLIPLTGVTLPFVSYGGTSLVSSMCLIGLLQGVASLNEDDLEEDAGIASDGLD